MILLGKAEFTVRRREAIEAAFGFAPAPVFGTLRGRSEGR
jgi:hypothetical protein